MAEGEGARGHQPRSVVQHRARLPDRAGPGRARLVLFGCRGGRSAEGPRSLPPGRDGRWAGRPRGAPPAQTSWSEELPQTRGRLAWLRGAAGACWRLEKERLGGRPAACLRVSPFLSPPEGLPCTLGALCPETRLGRRGSLSAKQVACVCFLPLPPLAEQCRAGGREAAEPGELWCCSLGSAWASSAGKRLGG